MIVAGVTPGLGWEIANVAVRQPAAKTLIALPAAPLRPNVSGDTRPPDADLHDALASYERFRAELGRLFPGPGLPDLELQAFRGDPAFVVFDDEWRGHLLTGPRRSLDARADEAVRAIGTSFGAFPRDRAVAGDPLRSAYGV